MTTTAMPATAVPIATERTGLDVAAAAPRTFPDAGVAVLREAPSSPSVAAPVDADVVTPAQSDACNDLFAYLFVWSGPVMAFVAALVWMR